MGIAPPPGLSPGIPLPPFAQTRKEAKAKPSAAQQTIKVEVGEEILKERADARKRAALYAALTAAVGLGLGLTLGRQWEGSVRSGAAGKGAATIERDVKAANDTMKALDAKLKEAFEKMFPQGDAATKMATRQFPEALVGELGGINIDFDATKLEGKQVGSLPSKTLKLLLAFTTAVDDANKTKNDLKGWLGAAKDPTLKAWKEEKDPVANFAVIFRGEAGGKVVATLGQVKEPFNWKATFPETFNVTVPEGTKSADKKVKPYAKGEVLASNDLSVPIDPKATAALVVDPRITNANKFLADLRKQLEGGANPDDPTNDTPGLIKQADDLTLQLHNFHNAAGEPDVEGSGKPPPK